MVGPGLQYNKLSEIDSSLQVAVLMITLAQFLTATVDISEHRSHDTAKRISALAG
jgi:hypothetical protein